MGIMAIAPPKVCPSCKGEWFHVEERWLNSADRQPLFYECTACHWRVHMWDRTNPLRYAAEEYVDHEEPPS